MIELKHSISPRDISGVTDLHTRTGFTKGAGVTIIQLEHDIFDDHSSMKSVRNHSFRTSSSTQLKRAFRAVKRAVHATAVGSIINDPQYGIAPDAEYVFIGFDDDLAPLEGIEDSLENILKKHNELELKPGDFINISMQLEGSNRRRPCVYPVDARPDIKDLINEITNELGMIVVIAAGNGAVDLDDAALSLGLRSKKYTKLSSDSLALKVGYTNFEKNHVENSNYGNCVHLSAQAVDIKAACHSYDPVRAKGDLLDVRHDGFARTSAAAPIVAASLACIQSCVIRAGRRPLTRNEILEIVELTGSLPVIEGDKKIGVIPNVKGALKRLELLPPRV